MTVKAVYEAGVLRPLQPLDFPEGQEIDISIPPLAERNEEEERKEILRRLEAGAPDPREAAEILASIAAMPMEAGGEPFSGEDHDRILYGGERGAW